MASSGCTDMLHDRGMLSVAATRIKRCRCGCPPFPPALIVSASPHDTARVDNKAWQLREHRYFTLRVLPAIISFIKFIYFKEKTLFHFYRELIIFSLDPKAKL